MEQTAAPLLCGKGLNKTYKSNGRVVRPLQDVDFALYPGEVLGIVGESGSGKSTLFKVVCGMEKPDSGHLYYQGKEYTGDGPEKTGRFLQMIFQDAYGSFDPRMTMERSLREGSDANRDEIVRIIGEVGLDSELLGRRPRNLSGGQCQRMSIARALLSHATVLLCDEITSALDVTTQAQVVRLLNGLREIENVSILFVSHDLALVSMICDRVMVLKGGVVMESGPTDEVIHNPQNDYTRKLLNSVIAVEKM
ncbi:MAG: ATP-binding cassette domain-containing protein [Mogibacterium sp.]|nr:ATP-binding cassette domain-containing protein [Mogibacterium sp.]